MPLPFKYDINNKEENNCNSSNNRNDADDSWGKFLKNTTNKMAEKQVQVHCQVPPRLHWYVRLWAGNKSFWYMSSVKN